MKREYKSKRNKDMFYAQQTARTLKLITNIDVFENSRRKEVVELRSLLVYILRNVEDMTYETIKEFFNLNGKEYDHATALHAYKNYEMYCKYNKNLDKYFEQIVNKSESDNAKKLVAKSIIDNSGVEVAEMFTYMINN
jgi:hypothetical protein